MNNTAKQHSFWGPMLVLITAVILFALGIAMGEPASFFEKAIRVCTQCIGLG